MNLNIKVADIDNWHDLINLSVGDDQIDYIESNVISIAESKFIKDWVPVGIYNYNTLIGFAMYGLLKNEDRVWLDRFMIDYKFQGKGYGRASLDFIIRHIKNEYNCNELYLSIFEDNKSAIYLYKSLGFVFNGEIDLGGEKVMVLNLCQY